MIDRYSNPEIAAIWSLENKFEIWKDIEILACEVRMNRGEIPKEDFEEIKAKAKFDVPGILELEKTLQHDVIAFLTNMGNYIGPASRHVHYGLTSSDIGDTALCVQMSQAMDLILKRLDELIASVKEKAEEHKMTPCIGRSHGIHAEPMTLGLKFALFYEELKRNRERMLLAKKEISVGKFSGAVGTFSNIDPEIEEFVCSRLGLEPDPITTQVITRDRHAFYASVLGICAGTLDRFATEIRLLQKTEGREVEEPFGKGQKGSSAMPHKRNPVICERISGISRVIRSNALVATQNMPLWHERDISHSSAERIILPDSTIALEYILERMNYVVKNMHIYPEASLRVMDVTRGLFYSQKAMLQLIEKGGFTREKSYAIVQKHAMDVWADIHASLKEKLLKDPEVSSVMKKDDIDEIFQVEPYLKRVDFVYRRLGLK
ncbi:MAG TPA: adenylosuccinate lyase [Leptospiraceae bacterium]|nr:adenylosuccinate lyase [Leptospiraceae bacterium]HMZ59376.1 adenylosuccinate lyase [Leptospiraceae bacterium]HNF14803.1 adenylosuccinate lyase [Leptospiraceae bacterium]HNF25244.1 adenylosuccinate lyase [Leptospiraceae bacterium]HNM01580.1 adenylosuccinate lyase [Leptospiraceae bacterium]